jgi:hypothetical protein
VAGSLPLGYLVTLLLASWKTFRVIESLAPCFPNLYLKGSIKETVTIIRARLRNVFLHILKTLTIDPERQGEWNLALLHISLIFSIIWFRTIFKRNVASVFLAISYLIEW